MKNVLTKCLLCVSILSDSKETTTAHKQKKGENTMKFYKVKREAYDYFNKFQTVKDELLTEKERNTKARYIKDDVFEVVEVSKKKTYWFFGARFAM